MMSKQKRLVILILVFLILGGIYWGAGNTPLTLPVTYIYYALCLILSVLYVLVAGGLRPILDEDRQREEQTREKYLRDKGKLHPIKRREKYRRFRIKIEEKENAEARDPLPPPPNLLKIPEGKRPLYCQILLLAVIPLYLIFLLDWIYLHFFI